MKSDVLVLKDDNMEEIVRQAINIQLKGAGVGIDTSNVNNELRSLFMKRLEEETENLMKG